MRRNGKKSSISHQMQIERKKKPNKTTNEMMDRKISNAFSGQKKQTQRVQRDVICVVTLAVVVFFGLGALYIRGLSEALRQEDIRNNSASRAAAIVKPDNSSDASSLPDRLTLRTRLGDIKIILRPDLSLESVEYIKGLLDSPNPCPRCRFYRAEKPGIIQGMLAKDGVPPNTVLGECPEEFRGAPKHDCPEHDPNCGCHGPIMHRGMVGWAAGEGGPDFFIDMYPKEADWWANDHTVWGEIVDEDSLIVADSVFEEPAERNEKVDITYLNEQIHIDIL